MIKLQVIGNLGKDAELKIVNGKKVLNFSIAHSTKFKNKDSVPVERTIWVECGLWDNENLAPFLKKGKKVFVEGEPDVRAYVDNNGELRSSLRLNVFRLELLSPKDDDSKNADNTPEAVKQSKSNKALSQSGKGVEKGETVPDGVGDLGADDDLPF